MPIANIALQNKLQCAPRRAVQSSFTDCVQQSTTGYIRFDTPEQAKIALDNTDDGKIVVCDCAAFVKVLEGEEELEFFTKVGHICVAQARLLVF